MVSVQETAEPEPTPLPDTTAELAGAMVLTMMLQAAMAMIGGMG